MGFTLEKTEKFEEAEKFYLEGLKIKPNHNGINEYLGELYVKTGRLELAKDRLAVLKNCNCEEYNELKEIIEKELNAYSRSFRKNIYIFIIPG